MSSFPILLAVHIILAVALLLPSVLLPFVLRRSSGAPGPLTRALMAMQGTGTLLIAGGLALTGAAMLWILGPELLTRPWLLVGAGALRDQPRGGGVRQPAEPAAAGRARRQPRRMTTTWRSGARASSATWRTAWRR